VAQGKSEGAKLISSGKAWDRFLQMVELQGGDSRAIEDTKRLPQARRTMQITSHSTGYLASLACEQIGTACVILGGGRERKEDSVDPTVGIVLHKKVGDAVSVGEPVATIHYNDEGRAARARQIIEASCEVTNAKPTERRPLILRIIGRRDIDQTREKN
jgi:thymidine phosphorylase